MLGTELRLAAPRDQISHSHGSSSSSLTSISLPADGSPRVARPFGLRCLGLVDLLDVILADGLRPAARGDLDPARLQRLGNLALQLDGEQPVVEVGGHDPHVIGEIEALLEGAGRDAPVQDLHALGLGCFWPVTMSVVSC